MKMYELETDPRFRKPIEFPDFNSQDCRRSFYHNGGIYRPGNNDRFQNR